MYAVVKSRRPFEIKLKKACIVGAFYDKQLIDIMKIPTSHEPLLVMPVGYPVDD